MTFMVKVERKFYIVIKEVQTNNGGESLCFTHKLQFKSLLHRMKYAHTS